MNVFEMFGFFILGSAVNMLLLGLCLVLLIKSIKNALNENVKEVGTQLAVIVDRADNIVKVFKKGENNGESKEMS